MLLPSCAHLAAQKSSHLSCWHCPPSPMAACTSNEQRTGCLHMPIVPLLGQRAIRAPAYAHAPPPPLPDSKCLPAQQRKAQAGETRRQHGVAGCRCTSSFMHTHAYPHLVQRHDLARLLHLQRVRMQACLWTAPWCLPDGTAAMAAIPWLKARLIRCAGPAGLPCEYAGHGDAAADRCCSLIAPAI